MISVILLFLIAFCNSQDLSNHKKCLFRCTANCYTGQKNIDNCESKCAPYDDPRLCDDSSCWDVCRDLGTPVNLNSPVDIQSNFTGSVTTLKWTPIANVQLYVIQYKTAGSPAYDENDYTITSLTKIDDFRNPMNNFCSAYSIRILSITGNGVSNPAKNKTIDTPKPIISAKMNLISMEYFNDPLIIDDYKANGTIIITFGYAQSEWPLGQADLTVEPLFHLINCAEPDLSQSIPLPDFVPGSEPNTLVGRVGSDMMYRKCRYVYYAQGVRSAQCKSSSYMQSPPPDALQTLNINCGSVSNNPCGQEEVHQAPVCGQIDTIHYRPLGDHDGDVDDIKNLTVEVTFDPIERPNEAQTLYWVGFYGEAISYRTKEEEAFLGVNISSIMGNVSTCIMFAVNGNCLQNTNNSVAISGLRMDQLYGITFCAVKDPQNLIFPNISSSSRAIRPKADKIFISSKDYEKSYLGVYIGCGALLFFIIVVVVTICIICYVKKKQRTEKHYQLKVAQLEREKENRYTDFPKKHDIWEIERRNLIIHSDNKLGSGAFGAVYLGKLLGKSLGHKDANSPLGVNLMRAENCQVAVKMLPEYADELSKSEFLREIGLMKTLGYHERLVNMLACITDSEPLCLVVEYCSDGDLLDFLRQRCKYMMKLDEAGINYHESPIDDNYDMEMIITVKQLLMFAVQICYGLEYLSQKGFVHRDVAARNILVHDKNSCKIGDFGLCRYIYADSAHYKSKGGRLPLKWMSPEAIRHYEFSNKSDVWSFGVLLFEIITLGGSPYPGVQPEDMLPFLEQNGRMAQPDNCPDQFYSVMTDCWAGDVEKRPEFSVIRQKLAGQLEQITEEYSYLKLDAQRDYYNVQYDHNKPDVIVIPESESTISNGKNVSSNIRNASFSSIDSIPLDDIHDYYKGELSENEKNQRKEHHLEIKDGAYPNSGFSTDESTC